ncbi:hypothetical protein KXD40_003732 [Peronospora effusa]|uniref:Glutathione transferase n=1 Tax=Peronospora effusa TaxID=542832 RepID=A0A3M6VDL2_9STRA|nr:hypothetical protein DD238_005163 [Peronospora effusa]RQM13231.1 hypothetical protein DD237_005731 [Peronospora effusa]UIZ22674.1 hypothetical protein KXD40_003732 [Peronospora effusa]CAI5703352.1 unnamed protein product [Peronospora effusa]
MSVTAVQVTLQPAHGYVPLVVIGAGLVGVWAGFKVSTARKQYSVPDPQILAEKKDKNVIEIDCVQRAHQNIMENLPLFYATLATSSIYRPKVAAVAGVVRIVGFIMYIKGTGDPKKRRHGTFGYLGMLVMLGLSLEASLRILGYI